MKGLFGTSIVERDGRVYCGNEDWGGVVVSGDTMPCGCKWSPGDMAGEREVCPHHCHDLYRMVHHLG